MALTARCEGVGGLSDGDVRLSGQTVLSSVLGYAHAGGSTADAADKLIAGYWLICVRDRNWDYCLGKDDAPYDAQWYWFSPGDGYHAVGWDGAAANLLQGGKTFTLTAGANYLLAIVAVGAAGERSADVAWPLGGPPAVEDLLGMTADGLAGRNVSDYEATQFRCNRCDPPTRMQARGAGAQ